MLHSSKYYTLINLQTNLLLPFIYCAISQMFYYDFQDTCVPLYMKYWAVVGQCAFMVWG